MYKAHLQLYLHSRKLELKVTTSKAKQRAVRLYTSQWPLHGSRVHKVYCSEDCVKLRVFDTLEDHRIEQQLMANGSGVFGGTGAAGTLLAWL